MARNFDSYSIESLQVPTLILHAQDDKLASYEQMEKAVYRFPNCTFIPFETGGHMMVGHSEEIQRALSDFTAQ
jgi:pimeloyl-ACP methyl ester carboxylesterase